MILITGHKGFIGSNLTKKLDLLNVPYIGYDVVDGNDIRDEFKLDKCFEEHQVNMVVHLAARAGVRRGENYREEYLTTNVLGTDNVLRMSEKYKVKKVVMFSSSSVYGAGNGPISFYGMTKSMGEMLPNRYDLPCVLVIRPFTVYGNNGRKDQVIIKWINQIKSGKPISFYGDGSTARGYTYVGDLVLGVLAALNKNIKGKHIVDMGGSEVVTLSNLLDIFKQYKPSIEVEYLPMPKADVKESKADLQKAFDLFGWTPKQNFREKVIEIIKENL